MYIEYKFNFFKFKILNADINSSLKYGILNKYRCDVQNVGIFYFSLKSCILHR